MFPQATLRQIAQAHCQREVDSMGLEELIAEAKENRMSQLQNAAGGICQDDLLETLLNWNKGDTDLMRRFMVDNGVDDNDAENAISKFMA